MNLGVDRPAEHRPESVEMFVEAYERSYLWETEIPANANDAFVEIHAPTATRDGDGFVVEMHVDYGYQPPSSDTDGPAPYADSIGVRVQYYVTPDVVRRAESPDVDSDPSDWELLECE